MSELEASPVRLRGAAATRDSYENWLARIGLPKIWTVLAGAIAVVLLLALHGQLPALVSSTSAWFNELGLIECGSLSLRDLASGRCALIGAPSGASIMNGVAFVGIGSVLIRIFGMTAEWALAASSAIMMTIAFAGTHQLARRVGLGRVLAFLVAILFLSSPTVFGMEQFGTTFWGIALIPSMVYVALRATDELETGSVFRRVLALLGWWSSVVFMLALDGYGFVMSQFFVGVILAYAVLSAIKSRTAWIGAAGFVLVNVVGFLVYRIILPGAGSWEKSSIDLFRAMGVDLTTLVLPSNEIWWSRFTGVGVEPSTLWGDGSNSADNYLGFGFVFLAVTGFVAARKRMKLVIPLSVVAGLALLLSLGPSVKLGDVRGPLQVPVTYASYLMPPHSALIGLPTTWIYEHVPGFDFMRATYRWLAVTRIAILLLAGLGVERLLASDVRGFRRFVALGLCALSLVELAPNLPVKFRTNAAKAEMVRVFNRDVLSEMRDAIPVGSRVVFAPYAEGGAEGGNDLLANYLAPMLVVTSYNVGGDKALDKSRSAWPEPVSNLLLSENEFAPAVERVLTDGYSDMVVIPFFDLRWSAYSWPTSGRFSKRGFDAADAAESDARLVVTRYDHFATVTVSH